MNIQFKALIGSRAYGIHREDSDYDWRGFFITPTREILSLNYKPKVIETLNGEKDDTFYEIGHFIHLCMKANPNVLEILFSPIVETETEVASELKSLKSHLFSPLTAFKSFSGYSQGQIKKLYNEDGSNTRFGLNDTRTRKAVMSYLRVNYNLMILMMLGSFSVEVHDTELKEMLLHIRDNGISCQEELNGFIVHANNYRDIAQKHLNESKDYRDYDIINNFLLNVRKEHYESYQFT